MSTPRSYDDRCGIARALDVIGERWALLIVRELLLGPKRFTDLRSGLPKVGPDVLSQRLRELERSGIVRRERLAPPAASRVYELTERGRELEPVILALGRWGSRAEAPLDEATFGADSAVLALKTLFDPRAVTEPERRYELRFGEQQFSLVVSPGGLEAHRGAAANPTATITAAPSVLAQVLWHGRDYHEALRTGALVVEGDSTAAQEFLTMFPL